MSQSAVNTADNDRELKRIAAYQAERYYRPDNVETSQVRAASSYGEAEREISVATNPVIHTDTRNAAGMSVIKDTISDTAKDSIKQTVAEKIGEISSAISAGGDDLTDQVKRKASKYGYKTGKYAIAGGVALVRGSIRLGTHKTTLSKSVVGSGKAIGKIIRAEMVKGVKDFQGSDDLGVKALKAPKDLFFKTRSVFRAVKGTARTVKATAHGIKAIVTGAKALLSNPIVLKISAVAGGVILLVALIMSVVSSISSIIPSVSLKSDIKELTRTYQYITQLDAELTQKIRILPKELHADKFYYYINGVATRAEDITIRTNADSILMYLDAKYEDYAFNKVIYGLLGGTNVQEEIALLHNALHSYTTHIYDEETYTTGGTATFIRSTDINVSTQQFETYLAANINTMLTPDEQEVFEVMNDIGTYTAKIELGSPFVGQDYSTSSRWGYRIHPINGEVAMHNGFDIPKPEGTPINNVMSGDVTFVGYDDDGFGNYCIVTSTDSEKEVLYAHMQRVVVSVNTPIAQGDIVGYVGNTGTSTGAHLHIEYSVENGFSTNPAFFLDGAS